MEGPWVVLKVAGSWKGALRATEGGIQDKEIERDGSPYPAVLRSLIYTSSRTSSDHTSHSHLDNVWQQHHLSLLLNTELGVRFRF